MSNVSANPLLSLGLEIPFDQIQPEHVVPAVTTLLEQARARLTSIEDTTAPPSYDNSLAALEAATEPLEIAMSVISHLEAVVSVPALREAHNTIQPEVSAFYASIPLREKLYQRLRAFSTTPEALALDSTRKRLLQKTLDDFRRHGAELVAQGKEQLQLISRRLAELTTKFAQNVVDATAEFELIVTEEARLAGLPAAAREAARADAERKSIQGWRFSLQAPSVVPALTYLEDRTLREALQHALSTRASSGQWNNVGLIEGILELRAQKATLLGYRDFADLVLEDRMAGSGAGARRFVDDLAQRARPSFERENSELTEFARTLGGFGSAELKPWDIGFVAEKMRQRLYDFDEEALRPYFPVEQVLSGLFKTTERLYGVRVEQAPSLARWHTDVKAYRLLSASGALLALFYIDLYPRDEKRGGAWMHNLITGVKTEHTTTAHVALICTNVTPPIQGRPALLTHQEVETLFHEFGHLIHHCLSEVSVRSLAGTNVAWDFVELPSQIMENWCWEREGLDEFARHYASAERIPQDLFEKLIRTRTFRQGNATMRQLGFATTDLALHREYDPRTEPDLLAYARRVSAPFAPTELSPDYAMIASFTHLFTSGVGYAAGYYSYKWAEVLDADAFTRFKREGIFNPQVGQAFREAILSRGDSDEPMVLYKRFMGREPSLSPLLERSGLADSAPQSTPALGSAAE